MDILIDREKIIYNVIILKGGNYEKN